MLAHKIDVLTRHCEIVGRDVTEIRKTVGFFDDPFSDVDGYLRRVERMAGLGVDMINTGPVPGSPDPAGFVKRFGDEVMPRLVEVG